MDLQRRRLLQQVHLPVADVSVGSARRWAADPLVLLGVVAVAALVLLLAVAGGAELPWQPAALLGVVAAGLALSGST